MKNAHYPFILLLASLTACATTHVKTNHVSDPKDLPETVLITYHVKPGKEAELENVLRREWKIYRNEHLVFARPHLIVRDKESGDKTRVVEVFTWVSHSAPDHAPDSVKAIWNDMQALCEPRDGHGGLEGGEVEILAPKIRRAR
jgi:hypothetical protein